MHTSCLVCGAHGARHARPPYGIALDHGHRMMDDSLFIGTHTQSDDDTERVPALFASRGAARPTADEEEQLQDGTTQYALGLAQALVQAQSAHTQAQSAQAQAQAHISELLALLAADHPKASAARTPALSSPHGAKQDCSHERVDIEAHYGQKQASSRLAAVTKSSSALEP